MNLLGQMAGAVFLGGAGPCGSNFAALPRCSGVAGCFLGELYARGEAEFVVDVGEVS